MRMVINKKSMVMLYVQWNAYINDLFSFAAFLYSNALPIGLY